ncbi:MAG: LamG-like jellyroll fold domain-containing protein [Bacteroidales bacterium]|nr:LamG-like jellyroll fold domain-containing protein [Bacteroidales bacterium]
MKNKHVFMSLVLVVLAISVAFIGCKKDPEDLKLNTLVAGTIDLNAATAPNTVPLNPTIVATFNVDVDPLTAIAANITLTQNYDAANIALTITVSGKTITIVPTTPLSSGALYDLKFLAGLKSTDNKALTAITRTFTTAGTFAPAGVKAHWKFEDNANDAVGTYNPLANGIVEITYTASRNTAAGKAATFNGTTSIIEIPNADVLINTKNFTMSFWVKAEDQGKGHFVIGLGAFLGLQFEMFGNFEGAKFAIRYELADGTTDSEDMWFPSDATFNGNDGWQGWDFAKAITAANMIAMLKDKWLHVTYTYNGDARKGTLYYNGEKMKSFDFNLWPTADPKRGVKGMKYGGVMPDVKNEMAFGFIQSRAGTMWATEPWGGYTFPGANHFKGQLDDIRIFHKVLTQVEITLMYNSEKP